MVIFLEFLNSTFFTFSFAFNFDCETNNTPPNPGIAVTWNGNTRTWSAIWFSISDCDLRRVDVLDNNLKFIIEGDTVKVRVPMADLAEMVEGFDEIRSLSWTAYSRRCPYTSDNTEPVDAIPGSPIEDLPAFFELRQPKILESQIVNKRLPKNGRVRNGSAFLLNTAIMVGQGVR